MGRGRRKRRNHPHASFSLICLLASTMAGLLLSACRPASTPEAVTTPRPPTVRFLQAAPTLCRDATQLRLDVQVAGPIIQNEKASWSLYRKGKDQPLNQGPWSGESGELYIPFPDGSPLQPGDYEIRVKWQDRSLTRQPFTIQAEAPSVEKLGIALTPDGETQSQLMPGIRHIYVQLTYDNACPGAPYWLTVTQKDAVVCKQNGGLDAQRGMVAIPCYQNDGQAFGEGTYDVTVTLMDDIRSTQTFAVTSPSPTPTPTSTPSPSPTPTPTPLTPVCAPLFTAAGLTPEGEPFLSSSLFDWYTQVVYVGTECDHLVAGTTWQSTWYRDGEQVRTQEGRWAGEPKGVIWDSLTGVPGSPFLIPGTYTITLKIEATAPLTAEIEVLSYPSEE